MTLIKSISGIRGTIGGEINNNLTPIDIVKFTSAYAKWLKENVLKSTPVVVLGRDARISGTMVNDIIEGTLIGCGINIINVGLCTTPGTEMAVIDNQADGGIIITASHNPKQWNALKLLNNLGEFLNEEEGHIILKYADEGLFNYSQIDDIGKVISNENYMQQHINHVLSLSAVDVQLVKSKKYKVVIDAVNSVGGIVIPKLLTELGCEVIELNCEANGEFSHNPEPIPENLNDICDIVRKEKADLGIVVDPDVDRLALVQENGELFGEEYTLVAVADYILSLTPGNTVSNLSSSRALRDITQKYGCSYSASAVGEVNVTTLMKQTNAIIGGEGNGGVIYPALHYGRDALVGIALFLTYMAKLNKTASEIKLMYPSYHISKNKIELDPRINVEEILDAIKEKYKTESISDIDGVKIDFPSEWVHLRKSNTEPIIRIYSESKDEENAIKLANTIIKDIQSIINI